jgi:hypothetical protein
MYDPNFALQDPDYFAHITEDASTLIKRYANWRIERWLATDIPFSEVMVKVLVETNLFAYKVGARTALRIIDSSG